MPPLHDPFTALIGRLCPAVRGLLLSCLLLFAACGGEEPVPPLSLEQTTLPGGKEREPYDARLEPAGGAPPYLFEVAGGELPYGVRLDDQSGALTGTASQAGQFTFEVRVRDEAGQTASRPFSVTIDPWNSPSRIACGETATVTLTESALDDEGGHQFQSSRAAAFYALTVPPWGTTSVSIRASSPDGDPAVYVGRPGEDPGSELVAYYSLRSSRPGDDEARIHQETSPSLTSYLEYQADIALVVAATVPGTMELEVECGTGAVITTPFLPNARAGQPYQASMRVISGTPPYTLSALSLPPGLELGADGTFTGTIEAPGEYAAEVRVTDAFGLGETRRLALWAPDVAPLACGDSVPVIFSTWAFNGQQGLATVGGAAFFELELPDGTSAATLELAHEETFTLGLYQGSPSATAGSSRLEDYLEEVFDSPEEDPDPVVLALDATTLPTLPEYGGRVPLALAARDGFGGATLKVACDEALEVASWYLPNAAKNQSYEVKLEALGGAGAPRWEAVGELPEGLELTGEGGLRGTPAASGRSSIEVRVRDEAGGSASRRLELSVGEEGSWPCGLAMPITCGQFKSGTLTSSAWQDRVEVDFSSAGGTAMFCLLFPAESSSVALTLDSLTGDSDLFLGYAGAPPGDLEERHYRTFSSYEGDDSLTLDGSSYPPLDAYAGVAAVAVPAWEAGAFLLSVTCR